MILHSIHIAAESAILFLAVEALAATSSSVCIEAHLLGIDLWVQCGHIALIRTLFNKVSRRVDCELRR